jgi:PAS domain S-box-containing protein
LATLFTGQLLHEPPDEEFFRRQAREYGFDETAYIEALRRVPIIPKERIESIMIFFSQLAQFLALLGLEKKRQLEAANKSLKEREERLRLVLEASHDGFWDMDIETGYLYFSPRCFEMLGYSPEKVEPHIRSWQKLVHPDDMPVVMKVLDEHLQGLTTRYESEYRLLTGSGEWKWVLDRGKVVVRDEHSRPLRMAGTLLDITERKQAEEALQRLSAELELQVQERTAELMRVNETLRETLLQQKALLDSIPDIAWLKDQESRIIAVNQPYGQACGVKPADLVGKTDLDIWPKELAERYMADDRQVIMSGRMKQVEEPLIDRRGYQTWIDTIKVPILNEYGWVIGTAGIARDITDRRRLEDELRKHRDHLEELVRERTKDLEMANKGLQKEILDRQRAEEALETEHLRIFSLLERLPATVCLIGPNYSIAFANKSIRENFGELKGRPCYKVFHGLKAPCEDCLTLEVLATNTPMERERTVFNGDNYQNFYYPFHDIDGSLLTLVLGINITEQKRMGKEIARLDRLNLVGEMAAGIGHEIRNPMTTVRGFLQMLGEKNDCTKYKDYFNLMIEELDRANSIITEYLSLAKNKPVELKRQNLNKIVTAIFPLIAADAMVTDKYVEVDLDDIPKLLLDEKEIRQLILNLVRNGLEAMSPRGHLIIKTSAEDEEVVLAVKDYGRGISPDVLEKIGTPFYTTKENGTGLGLAVCYSIAARHNAAIKVETGTGGTTFYVRFKANKEALNNQITMQTQLR